jgi:UDP-galactose transporter B1
MATGQGSSQRKKSSPNGSSEKKKPTVHKGDGNHVATTASKTTKAKPVLLKKQMSEMLIPESATADSSGITRLIICFLGINICYMYYGIVQERLFRPDPRAGGKKFDNTLFLFGVQCLMNALFALVGRILSGRSSQSQALSERSKVSPLNNFLPTKASGWLWLGFISASYLLAMLTSNEALRYVSYPVQALAKSCKMVPVMLGNALVGVKYRWHEYLIVLTITAGIALSQQSGGKGVKENTWFGMVLLFISLVLDGITGSHQHLFDREYKLSTHDLMLGMNAFALLYTSIALVFTGEGSRGLEYVISHPWLQQDIFLFGLASALGQNFIFYTITGPGPLVCTTITTMRKFFTILYSVIQYPDNSFTSGQWVGVVLVFGGLGAEIVEKAMKKRNKSADKVKHH